MLILCSGPDTYQARKKAQDLTQAFRTKHDPSGFSIERVAEPSLTELLHKMSAPSFFSPKRFIRCDGLFAELSIADLRKLLPRLHDENTILVTVEDEAPKEKVLQECAGSFFVHYPFLPLSRAAFVTWCEKEALSRGISSDVARRIAEACDGDSWRASTELQKVEANPGAPRVAAPDAETSIFNAADAVLLHRPGWRQVLESISEEEALLPTLLNQTRASLRIRDRAITGLHPFVVKKLGTLRVPQAESLLLLSIASTVAERSSLAGRMEWESLLV